MKNKTYNKGPWTVEIHKNDEYQMQIWNEKEFIAIIPPSIVANRAQNAMLIAAAPEMFECLKNGLECGVFDDAPEFKAHAKSILKKARGGK